MWWQFLHKHLWHCADKRCYKATLDWRLPHSWPLETESRRQEALPWQCSFTARCFVNTTKSTLILPSSELDFQVAKTDSDALFKLAELFLCTEEVILNGLSDGKRQREIMPTFCHDGCQRTTSKLFFCETLNTALCATQKRIIYVYLHPGVCILHWKYSPLSCFAVHTQYPHMYMKYP